MIVFLTNVTTKYTVSYGIIESDVHDPTDSC